MKLLNSQSLNYVTRKRQQELKKIDGLQSSLHLLDAAPGENKHTLFFDSKKDGVSRFSVSMDAVWESHTFRVNWLCRCPRAPFSWGNWVGFWLVMMHG